MALAAAALHALQTDVDTHCGCHGNVADWHYDGLLNQCGNGTHWTERCRPSQSSTVCRNNLDW